MLVKLLLEVDDAVLTVKSGVKRTENEAVIEMPPAGFRATSSRNARLARANALAVACHTTAGPLMTSWGSDGSPGPRDIIKLYAAKCVVISTFVGRKRRQSPK